MLGLNDKSWLLDEFAKINRDGSVCLPQDGVHIGNSERGETYYTYFGMGHSLQLIDQSNVFKVSPAGLALGECIVKQLSNNHGFNHYLLDMGTGSGVLALLLRQLGGEKIFATDVSAAACELAKKNEILNFENDKIQYKVGDLFAPVSDIDYFDFIVFNPPGWRTPSKQLLGELVNINDNQGLDLSAMFDGDKVAVNFLNESPHRLGHQGKALIGLNSIVGIQDVLQRHKASYAGESPLTFRLIERHVFPLLFYSEPWQKAKPSILREFNDWLKRSKSAFSMERSGNLYWSYEIIECKRR